jgi:hypothetical protein
MVQLAKEVLITFCLILHKRFKSTNRNIFSRCTMERTQKKMSFEAVSENSESRQKRREKADCFTFWLRRPRKLGCR